MRILSRALLCLILFVSIRPAFSQTCNNWMQLPSYQSYASMGDLDVPGHTITVEATFMRTAPYSNGPNWAGDLVSKHNNPPDVNYLLRPNNAEITTTTGYHSTPAICEIQLNKIYHAAMTYDGTTLKFYRNGFLMSSTPCTGDMYQNDFDLRVGLYDAVVHNTNLIGYINEVRIWNVARTQAEIQAYMNTSLPNPTTQTGLLAYYTFDNLLNKQGNAAWNGTLGGTAVINQTIPDCTFVADSCGKTPLGIAGFDIPAKVCVNTPVTITNTSSGASSYYWNFCVADINQAPIGANLGNTGGQLRSPVFMDYVQFNGNYYGFVMNFSPGSLVRLDYGNSLLNTPTATNLGNFGNLITGTYGLEGIQVVQNEGRWYAIIVGGSVTAGITPRVVKIDFGSDLTNPAPVATNWGNIGGLNSPHDLHVFKEGNDWYGLVVNADNNTVTRLSFSSSFNNIPTGVNLGGFGLLAYPDGIFAMNDNGFWRVFVTSNNATSRLVRLDFGTSLLNTPTAVNLGSVGNIDGLRDIALIKYCDQAVGFGVNGTDHHLYRLNFASLSSPPVVTDLGNIGSLQIPHSISKLFRVNDDLYTFITNVGNNTITRLRFPGCTNASTPNSNVANPPPVIYNTPGFYNINLTIDDGLPTQQSICKQIEVVPGLQHRPTQNIQLCANQSTRLGSGTSLATYLWNTGETTDSITAVNPGIYWVETNSAGCTSRDSFEITIYNSHPDFAYKQDVCFPTSVQLTGATATPAVLHFWDFGDGNTSTGTATDISHSYSSTGDYIVRYAAGNGTCADTVSKLISINILERDIITTNDTTICYGSTITLRTVNLLNQCWTPVTYMNGPVFSSPQITPETDMVYYVTAEVQGTNLIVNGDFSQGNTGFQSSYTFASSNSTEGQYNVGANPSTWNGGMGSCKDHTTTAGNMMMVNGSPTADAVVWKQTVNIIPNTNYAFSTWIQTLVGQNPARLQFSINGKILGSLVSANAQTCVWDQFYTTWNSGVATTAEIAIINKNTVLIGNDFALDDISFAPVTIQRDSIKVFVERPSVVANADTMICSQKPVQLTVTGSQSYVWSPATALTATDISNPVATPAVTTQYIVTGTSAIGCVAKDTVNLSIFAKPTITRQADTVICRNSSVGLWISGGTSYQWSPAGSLSDPASSNPVATPVVPTIYNVVITDANTCEYPDSVKIDFRPDPVFAVNGASKLCLADSVSLLASGGDVYSWSPSTGVSDPGIADPSVSPPVTTIYTVNILASVCGETATLQTQVNVMMPPTVRASHSNDIDCSYGESRLMASGARTYSWTPATTLNNPAVPNPLATPKTSTTYIVAGKDREGCTGYDSVVVKVGNGNKGGYLLPNAFTPNNDGLNDCFGVKYWGIVENIEFSVFDRWGVRVFYSKDPKACWDGTYKGVKQPGGVYVYMVKASTNCEEPVFRKGTFVLVR